MIFSNDVTYIYACVNVCLTQTHTFHRRRRRRRHVSFSFKKEKEWLKGRERVIDLDKGIRFSHNFLLKKKKITTKIKGASSYKRVDVVGVFLFFFCLILGRMEKEISFYFCDLPRREKKTKQNKKEDWAHHGHRNFPTISFQRDENRCWASSSDRLIKKNALEVGETKQQQKNKANKKKKKNKRKRK